MAEQDQQEDDAVKPPTEYLVEVRKMVALVGKGEDATPVWEPVGSVTVPARTSRKTALANAMQRYQALRTAAQADDGAVVRLIATSDVYERPVGYKQLPPQLVIGEEG
jgi:hypothetical protein